MTLADPIGDMITRIRNAQLRTLYNVKVPSSKYRAKSLEVLKQEAEQFYKVHEIKPFYNDLCDYLSSGPIVVMILEKEDAITSNRQLMGATDPKKAEEGTLRKKFGISIDKNSVHGSDSLENPKIEIDFFFKN